MISKNNELFFQYFIAIPNIAPPNANPIPKNEIMFPDFNLSTPFSLVRNSGKNKMGTCTAKRYKKRDTQ